MNKFTLLFILFYFLSFSIQETILNVIYAHKFYWNCYQYQETYSYHSCVVNNADVKTVRHMPVVNFR